MNLVKKISLIIIFTSISVISCLIVVNRVIAKPDNAIMVNTFDDELNDDEDCSLREAIEAANENQMVDNCSPGSSSSPDDIYLESGTYLLSQGDLNILSSLNLHGIDVESTIIDGGNQNRVFDLLSSGTVISITDITIQNGKTITNTGGGGGIYVHPGVNLTLENCRIINNETDSWGGGIDNWLGVVEITNCSIQGNSAEQGGGIYNDGILVLSNSIIDANTADVLGGGLVNSAPGVGKATIENVTFSRNTSLEYSGTGIYSTSPITLTNATIVHNFGTGAGFYYSGPSNLKNTIIALHGESDNCSGDETELNSYGHNLEDKNTCNFDPFGKQDQINVDPLLIGDTPQYNGGLTQTYALKINSPAIDNGTNTGCPATDQRGYDRPKDGDGDGTPVCDIGAFEANKLTILYLPLLYK
jgi:CSLREA domain-containing protein